MIPAVIFDLDGTLCDTTHRNHLLPDNQSIVSDDWSNLSRSDKWCAFHMECGGDKLIDPVAQILYRYWINNYRIIFCTARPYYVYDLTIDWIGEHFPGIKGFYDIHMRADKDRRKSKIVKQEMLNIIEQEYNVVCAFEDHPEVIEMYNENDVICLRPYTSRSTRLYKNRNIK